MQTIEEKREYFRRPRPRHPRPEKTEEESLEDRFAALCGRMESRGLPGFKARCLAFVKIAKWIRERHGESAGENAVELVLDWLKLKSEQ